MLGCVGVVATDVSKGDSLIFQKTRNLSRLETLRTSLNEPQMSQEGDILAYSFPELSLKEQIISDSLGGTPQGTQLLAAGQYIKGNGLLSRTGRI